MSNKRTKRNCKQSLKLKESEAIEKESMKTEGINNTVHNMISDDVYL